MPRLAHIALVVRDYDEAIAFYIGKLGFELVEGTYQPAQDKRWIVIRPPDAPAHSTTILLARDHARFTAAGVEWVRPPADHNYGRVAVWKDLYGNLWDLVQFAYGHPAASPAV